MFCQRQCALIHVEGLWAEDAATAEGQILHAKVDAGGSERRPGIRIARGLYLRSLRLGVAGRADVVEFHGVPPRPLPVEYKRGTPKAHRADEVQLCAQAMCLEEMCSTEVPEGALFYGVTRRRVTVHFDQQLRDLTLMVAEQARANIAQGITPPPVFTPACKRCSMIDLCQPQRLRAPAHVRDWLRGALEREGEPDA